MDTDGDEKIKSNEMREKQMWTTKTGMVMGDKNREVAEKQKPWALTEKQRERVQCVEKKRENELEHNNTADSKELILHQASTEAMYWSADECVCAQKGLPQWRKRLCVTFMILDISV